jgi:hypothetical protein
VEFLPCVSLGCIPSIANIYIYNFLEEKYTHLSYIRRVEDGGRAEDGKGDQGLDESTVLITNLLLKNSSVLKYRTHGLLCGRLNLHLVTWRIQNTGGYLHRN